MENIFDPETTQGEHTEFAALIEDIRNELRDTKKKRKRKKKKGAKSKKLKKLDRKIEKLEEKLDALLRAAEQRKPRGWGEIIIPEFIAAAPRFLDVILRNQSRPLPIKNGAKLYLTAGNDNK